MREKQIDRIDRLKNNLKEFSCEQRVNLKIIKGVNNTGHHVLFIFEGSKEKPICQLGFMHERSLDKKISEHIERAAYVN